MYWAELLGSPHGLPFLCREKKLMMMTSTTCSPHWRGWPLFTSRSCFPSQICDVNFILSASISSVRCGEMRKHMAWNLKWRWSDWWCLSVELFGLIWVLAQFVPWPLQMGFASSTPSLAPNALTPMSKLLQVLLPCVTQSGHKGHFSATNLCFVPQLRRVCRKLFLNAFELLLLKIIELISSSNNNN